MLSDGAYARLSAGVRGNYIPDAWPQPPTPGGITLSRAELERWNGEPLSDEQVERLANALPYSSVPEAIATIVAHFD